MQSSDNDSHNITEVNFFEHRSVTTMNCTVIISTVIISH
jgi:hypothetical protein